MIAISPGSGVRKMIVDSEERRSGTTLVELLIGIILISGMFGIGIATIRNLMLVESEASGKSQTIGNILDLEFMLRADVRTAEVTVVNDLDHHIFRITQSDGSKGPSWEFLSDRIVRTESGVKAGEQDLIQIYRLENSASYVTSLEKELFLITIDLGTQQYAEGQRHDQGVRLQWKIPVNVLQTAKASRMERPRS